MTTAEADNQTTVETEPDPQVGTPGSDPSLELVADAAPGAQADGAAPETPEPGSEPGETEAVRLARAREEGAEVARREADQRRVAAERIAVMEAEEQRQTAELDAEDERFTSAIRTFYDRIGDDEVRNGLIADEREKHKANRKEIVERPIKGAITKIVLRGYGDTPQNRRSLGGLDMDGLLTELFSLGYRNGQQSGPDDTKKVSPVAEWKDGNHQPSYKKGFDDAKAANPPAGTVSTNGTHGGGSGGLPSREEWTSASYDQRESWKQQLGRDVADRVFAQ